VENEEGSTGKRLAAAAAAAAVLSLAPATSARASSLHFRVREERADKAGKVSLRSDSKLYKIGLGRAHEGRRSRSLSPTSTCA
jgi:hypothetical protein